MVEEKTAHTFIRTKKEKITSKIYLELLSDFIISLMYVLYKIRVNGHGEAESVLENDFSES